ncbi:hypothetical protein [Micromonospora chokoriensis]
MPGWRLNFAAAVLPFVAGIITLLVTWVSSTNDDSPYWIGTGHLDFSHAELSRVSTEATAWLDVNGSVGGVNIVAAAVAVMVISRFGLRVGHRWAWWFLAFCFVWVGLHDAVMATRLFAKTGEPLMIMPYAYCILMAAGLLRSRRAVFADASNVSTSVQAAD